MFLRAVSQSAVLLGITTALVCASPYPQQQDPGTGTLPGSYNTIFFASQPPTETIQTINSTGVVSDAKPDEIHSTTDATYPAAIGGVDVRFQVVDASCDGTPVSFYVDTNGVAQNANWSAVKVDLEGSQAVSDILCPLTLGSSRMIRPRGCDSASAVRLLAIVSDFPLRARSQTPSAYRTSLHTALHDFGTNYLAGLATVFGTHMPNPPLTDTPANYNPYPNPFAANNGTFIPGEFLNIQLFGYNGANFSYAISEHNFGNGDSPSNSTAIGVAGLILVGQILDSMIGYVADRSKDLDWKAAAVSWAGMAFLRDLFDESVVTALTPAPSPVGSVVNVPEQGDIKAALIGFFAGQLGTLGASFMAVNDLMSIVGDAEQPYYCSTGLSGSDGVGHG